MSLRGWYHSAVPLNTRKKSKVLPAQANTKLCVVCVFVFFFHQDCFFLLLHLFLSEFTRLVVLFFWDFALVFQGF